MTYKEIKNLCDEKIKKYPQYLERYKKEILALKRFYDNNRNIYEEFSEKADKIDNRYVIPFLLGFTKEVNLENPLDMIQVEPGASGGIDIDSDFSAEAKKQVTEYLKERFGEDRVVSVGTYTKMGVASAAKDLLRIYEVPFKESNAFTSQLESLETWEKNLERLKFSRPDLYSFYEKHKDILDLVPYFVNKVRQCLPYYQKIDTTNGKKRICDLDPEKDFILFLDENKEIKNTNKYSIFNSGKKKIYELTTESGKKIRATEDHVFFLNGSCKKIKNLSPGEEIIVSSKEEFKEELDKKQKNRYNREIYIYNAKRNGKCSINISKLKLKKFIQS